MSFTHSGTSCSNLENGNTFGRTLQLRRPPSSINPPAPPDAPPFILSADHLTNTSPFTGIGLAHSADRNFTPEWVRMRAVLERGLAMRFWDGHRGVAYVLAVESEWQDELRSLALRVSAEAESGGGGDEPVAKPWEMEEMGQEEWSEWARWVTQEREAPCTRASGELRKVLLLEQPSSGSPNEDSPSGSLSDTVSKVEWMEVSLWETDDVLQGFEQRFYSIGRGTAGGYGFR